MNLLFSTPGEFELLIIGVAVIPFLILKVVYLNSLKLTLECISEENRKMAPGMVWFNLIPIVGLVYHFIIVQKLTESIKAEAASRSITINDEKPAYYYGLSMCILNCIMYNPSLALPAGAAALICWVFFGQKLFLTEICYYLFQDNLSVMTK